MNSLGRLVEAALFRLFRRPADVVLTAVMRSGESVRCGAFSVYLVSVKDRPGVLRKVTEALELIRTHDPRRHLRLTQNVDCIGVFGVRSRTQFLASTRCIVIREGFLAELGTDGVASVLAHEGCHARLHQAGIAYSPLEKERIERLGLRNQLWFIEKVPGSESLAHLTRKDFIAWKNGGR